MNRYMMKEYDEDWVRGMLNNGVYKKDEEGWGGWWWREGMKIDD